MKDVLIFLRSGETVENNDVDDNQAIALEHCFISGSNSVFSLSDSTGKAMFRIEDVAAIVINEVPVHKEITIIP